MEVNTYLRRDGIQDNEFNMGASHLGRSGRMYFGGINGFTIFYPDSIRHNPFIPTVVLTDFRLFNKPVPMGEEPGRPGHPGPVDQRDRPHRTDPQGPRGLLRVQRAALRLAREEQLRLPPRGIRGPSGTRWAPETTPPIPTFRPGEYTFRVRGSNNDGVWNEEGVAITLTVKPPFYRKAWFIGGVVVSGPGRRSTVCTVTACACST